MGMTKEDWMEVYQLLEDAGTKLSDAKGQIASRMGMIGARDNSQKPDYASIAFDTGVVQEQMVKRLCRGPQGIKEVTIDRALASWEDYVRREAQDAGYDCLERLMVRMIRAVEKAQECPHFQGEHEATGARREGGSASFVSEPSLEEIERESLEVQP